MKPQALRAKIQGLEFVYRFARLPQTLSEELTKEIINFDAPGSDSGVLPFGGDQAIPPVKVPGFLSGFEIRMSFLNGAPCPELAQSVPPFLFLSSLSPSKSPDGGGSLLIFGLFTAGDL